MDIYLSGIGLRFMMETIQVFQRHGFWSNIKIDTFDTAPYHFNGILTRKLDMLRGDSKGAYHHLRAIARIQGYICGR